MEKEGIVRKIHVGTSDVGDQRAMAMAATTPTILPKSSEESSTATLAVGAAVVLAALGELRVELEARLVVAEAEVED